MVISMACCQYPVTRLANRNTFNNVVRSFQLATRVRLLQRTSPHHTATSSAIRNTPIAKSFHAAGGSLRATRRASSHKATSASTLSASIGVTDGLTALYSRVAQNHGARTVGTAWIASTAKSAALTSLALPVTAATLGTTHGLSGSGGITACSGFWGSGKDNNKDDDDDPVKLFNKAVKAFFDEGKDREVNWPAELSFGCFMGGCCGFAAKKTGKLVVLGVGFMFVGIQALSHLGFLKLDYAKMQAYFTDALDVNRDGKVDGRDLRTLFDRAVQAGAFGLPAGSGFAIGAIMGFRCG